MKDLREWILNKIAKEINIDIKKYDKNEIKMGMDEELEHGKKNKNLNITNDDPVKTLKIVLAHLKEDPKYYTKLKSVM